MLDLDELSGDEKELLVECIDSLMEYLHLGVIQPAVRLTGLAPENILILRDQLTKLLQLIRPQDPAPPPDKVTTKVRSSIWLLPLLKRAIIHRRRIIGPDIEAKARLTLDPKLRRSVEEKLRSLTKLTEYSWFQKTTAYKVPKLSDFIDPRQAQESIVDTNLKPRVYDEKFGILLASNLFQSDLRHFRTMCELRNRPVSIAFIDIDDFKEFNTKYGEPIVDRDILPTFMAALEAHFFQRGHVYRHGGDEYVALLPNMARDEAALLLSTFQRRLETLSYYSISQTDMKPTVSIGVCELNDDCIFTESEGEERAARAKQYAKSRGKNRIASFKVLSDYKDSDMELIDVEIIRRARHYRSKRP